MNLVSRFTRNCTRPLSAANGDSLSPELLRQRIPAIFADAKHDSRSDRYTYIPTIDLVARLGGEGWAPTFAVQARSRDGERLGHAKHMLRFRHASTDIAARGEVPEIILINSHDGSTSYQMLGGMFRFVCCNGLVCGTGMLDVRVPHRGNVIEGVLAGAATILDRFSVATDSVDRMKAISLSTGEQKAFARAAIGLRFDDPEVVTVDQVNRARRLDDAGADVWSTLNRVQENLITGGLRMDTDGGRRQRSRKVSGIGENVRLNQALWTLGEEMVKLKA